METLRSGVEIAVGVLFVAGAVFGVAYTRSHTQEFHGSFAQGAWFGPGRWLVNRILLPNATVLTFVVIVFQVAVAVLIITRGELVAVGLVAGSVFSGLARPASSPGGTIGNLALAVIQDHPRPGSMGMRSQ